jgi:4-amino-4-deoxy-L-arabinose transferase-like glycosyltransferase
MPQATLTHKSPNRWPPWVLMVFVGLAIRVAVTHFLYPEWLDPFVLEHWAFGRIGRSLALGQGFGNPLANNTGPSALLPPVYPYILAGIFKVFGVYSKSAIIAALVLNGAISAATCVPVFFLARKSFGKRVAKWAGWGWALSPYGIYYGADWAWSTCLVSLLLCCLFLWALNLEDSDRILSWLGFGIVSGIATLTEPSVLSVLPFLGLWTCYRRYRAHRRWMLRAAVTILAVLAVVAPWGLRNYRIFHKVIPVRSGLGLELYIGNNGYSTSWVNRDLHPNHSAAEQSEYERDGEIAYMEHKREQAVDYIRAHPGWFAWMTLRRFIYLWTGYWSLSHEYLQMEPMDPPNIFVCTTLTVLALIGLWRCVRQNSALAIRFGIVLALYPLVYCISHPETYYTRPLDPIIDVLAAYAVVMLFARPRKDTPHTLAAP